MRFRVRTLLAIVALAAVVLWAFLVGTRSIEYARRARNYAVQERYWRLSAGRGRLPREFCLGSADYLAGLAVKYRRASWRFWEPVAPDPPGPGVEAYEKQKLRPAPQLFSSGR